MALGILPSPRDLSVPALPRPGRAVTGTLLGVAAALGATALWNYIQARRAEREHPPMGRFVEVDGVRLHYVDRGHGRPVVLLHGNMMLIEDWALSGVLDMAASHHRVLAFDRPGYGRSECTRDRIWTPAAQADLGPGMTVVAVDGNGFSPDILRDAVSTARTSNKPMQLLVNNEGALITYPIAYHGGQQYPHLVRDGAKPDSLSQIIAPLTPRR